MPIESMISDPVSFFRDLLISAPAILIALVLHECAHGYVAYRCGDPTAKMLGRLTLNPLKHLDPIGTLMMVFAGFGWARPVPVNPRNFKHYRRDDLLVSLAGIVTNLILFVFFSLIAHILMTVFLVRNPVGADGAAYMLRYALFFAEDLYTEYWGEWISILNQIICRAAIVNCGLAVFNLLPVPPLDGYHVLNDLVLKKSLFASPRVSQIASAALLLLVVTTDWLGTAMSWVISGASEGLGMAFSWIVQALGIL